MISSTIQLIILLTEPAVHDVNEESEIYAVDSSSTSMPPPCRSGRVVYDGMGAGAGAGDVDVDGDGDVDGGGGDGDGADVDGDMNGDGAGDDSDDGGDGDGDNRLWCRI